MHLPGAALYIYIYVYMDKGSKVCFQSKKAEESIREGFICRLSCKAGLLLIPSKV
jgi:hypothetical protein